MLIAIMIRWVLKAKPLDSEIETGNQGTSDNQNACLTKKSLDCEMETLIRTLWWSSRPGSFELKRTSISRWKRHLVFSELNVNDLLPESPSIARSKREYFSDARIGSKDLTRKSPRFRDGNACAKSQPVLSSFLDKQIPSIPRWKPVSPEHLVCCTFPA